MKPFVASALMIVGLRIILAGSDWASAAEPTEIAQIRAAVSRALPLIEKGAVGHRTERSTCFSCHNQGVPIVALTTARSRGLAIDEPELAEQLKFIADFLAKHRESNFLSGRGTGGGSNSAGYALLALQRGSWKPDESTAAVVEYLLKSANDSGGWRHGGGRPPSEASDFTSTCLAIRGLQKFGTEEQKERIEQRIAEAREWLVKTPAQDTEDRVFRLWGLHLAGGEGKDVKAASDELRESQREDGGWAQTDDLQPDAYATGSALVAPHWGGGLPTSDPAYRRGVRFLIGTQVEDGSWFVKSRSKPFQLYFESGFPHGADQFISIAASAWATTALALACPPQDATTPGE